MRGTWIDDYLETSLFGITSIPFWVVFIATLPVLGPAYLVGKLTIKVLERL